MNLNSSLLQNLEGKNVLLIGDVMLDRYLFGDISRISPEAPVPILDLRENESRLGGAANVALNLKALDANPILVSIIGKDQRGQEILDLLPEFGIPNRYLVQSSHRPTTVKSRILASNQQVLRIDDESKEDLNEEESESLIAQIRQIFNNNRIDVIIFQDYNKGVLTEKVIREVSLEALRFDIPVAVDPKFKNFWTYKKCTLFKPNLAEVKKSVPFGVEAEMESLQKASDYIRTKLGNKILMVTLSEDGVFIDDGVKSAIYPTTPRNISDVCGAGDSVIAISALCLSTQMPAEVIGVLSNLCGGQVCEKVGVVSINKSQLMEELDKIKFETQMN